MSFHKLVDDSFIIPTRVVTDKFIVVPYHSNALGIDLEAFLSSSPEYMGKVFSPDVVGIVAIASSVELSLAESAWTVWRARLRASFSYHALSLDEQKVLGGLYVQHSLKVGYDALAMFWVREDEAESGLNEALYEFTQQWVREDWPIARVAWPGRQISWDDWQRLPDKEPMPWEGTAPLLTHLPRKIVADDFVVSGPSENDLFKLAPLDFSLLSLDHEAYTSTINPHRENVLYGWPDRSLSVGDSVHELGFHMMNRYWRSGFAYAVLTPDENSLRGCIYIDSTTKKGFDAEAQIWVRANEIKTGLSQVLYDYLEVWLKTAWPFDKVGWPGRKLSLQDWAALPDK